MLRCSDSQQVQGAGGTTAGSQGCPGAVLGCTGKGQSCIAAGGCILPGWLPADSEIEMLGQQCLGEMGCEL